MLYLSCEISWWLSKGQPSPYSALKDLTILPQFKWPSLYPALIKLSQQLKHTYFFAYMFRMCLNFSNEYLQSNLLIILCRIARVDGEKIFNPLFHISLLFCNATQLFGEILWVLFLALEHGQQKGKAVFCLFYSLIPIHPPNYTYRTHLRLALSSFLV